MTVCMLERSSDESFLQHAKALGSAFDSMGIRKTSRMGPQQVSKTSFTPRPILSYEGMSGMRLRFLRRRHLDRGSVVHLKDATEEDWTNCGLLHHVPTTFQYGAHPSRVMQFCPYCHIKSRLDWKDTYARVMNRLWFTTPAIFAAAVGIITMALIVAYYVRF